MLLTSVVVTPAAKLSAVVTVDTNEATANRPADGKTAEHQRQMAIGATPTPSAQNQDGRPAQIAVEASDTDEGASRSEAESTDQGPDLGALAWRVGGIFDQRSEDPSGPYLLAVHPTGVRIAMGENAVQGSFLMQAEPWQGAPADQPRAIAHTSVGWT